MANVLDCGLEVSVFDLQSRRYIPFLINTLEQGMHPLISTINKLNSITTVHQG